MLCRNCSIHHRLVRVTQNHAKIEHVVVGTVSPNTRGLKEIFLHALLGPLIRKCDIIYVTISAVPYPNIA